MLDITLLKVEHKGELEAKKLLPYIEKCDVFAPEAAGEIAVRAMHLEKTWYGQLNLSRSRVAPILAKNYSSHPPLMADYNIKRDDYLFRNKKPLYYLEKWPEGSSLNDRFAFHHSLMGAALDRLSRRDITSFLNTSSQAIEVLANLVKLRDRHIAENITNAEHHIRTVYPRLTKSTLSLVAEIGLAHNPQIYTTLPLSIIDLSELDLLSRFGATTLSRLIASENQSECSPQDLLAFGLMTLKSMRGLSVDEHALISADFDELKRIAANL